MNEKLEKYIGELSPEMQEKARECKTTEELQALLAENDVELSEDALEAVAGGCGSCDCTTEDIESKTRFCWDHGTVTWYKRKCKKCGKISYACRDTRNHFALISEQEYNDLYIPFIKKKWTELS